MDQSYIMPFITSVQNVFETMLQLPVTVGTPVLVTTAAPANDVSGIIGMSGDIEGSVVLAFPTDSAQRIVTLLVGETFEPQHPDFADAVGELVNMVSGGAKAQFEGKQVSIGCPSVIIGADHVVHARKDVVCIAIPCTCDCGEFSVEVALRKDTIAAMPAGGQSQAA